MPSKVCSGCKKRKPVSSFYTRKDSAYTPQCKLCIRALSAEWYWANRTHRAKVHKAWRRKNLARCSAISKAWRIKNKARCWRNRKRWFLRVRYNMTFEDWSSMMERQDRRCAICRKQNKLNVDHNHTTGKVRGLLCDSCNLGLGYFKDRPDLFRLAAAYLETKT